ncbi:MAG: FecR domain-containing protein [Elusimicrobia bacterium]|nr:FecR domain-containing protein [Elusimicrobiota bacterium]
MRLSWAVAFVMALGGGTSFGQEDRWEARFTDVKGTVTVFTTGGDADGMPADNDVPLEEGDRIKTGDDGYAEVAIEGDSLVVLKANSQMTVASARIGASEIGLAFGSLLAKIQSALGVGGFRVRTPTAVAAVRGTEFGLDVAGEAEGNETHVGVFDEGKVEVSGLSGEDAETLMVNQETVVRKGSRPLPPYVIKRLMRHRKLVRGMGKRAQQVKKRWASLPADKRGELRQRWMEKARERMKKMREKALQRNKPRRPGAGSKPGQEKMEQRRQKIIRERNKRP